MSMTIAALPFIRTSAKESNGVGAAAAWPCDPIPPPKAATTATTSATVATASTKIPAVRRVFSSLRIGSASIVCLERLTLLLKCGEFGDDCSIVGKFSRIFYAEVCEEFDGRAIQVFAGVLGIFRAFKQSSRKKISQCRRRVDAADVVDAGARRWSHVENDREHFETRIADIALKLFLVCGSYHLTRFFRRRKADRCFRSYGRDAASLEAL